MYVIISLVIQSRVSGCPLACSWTTNNNPITSELIADTVRACVSRNDTAHPEFLHVDKNKTYDGLPLKDCLIEFQNNPAENTMNRIQINVGVQFFKLKNADSKSVSDEFPQCKKKSYYERSRKKEVRTAIAGKESFKSNVGDLLSRALEEVNDGFYSVSLGELVGSRRKADWIVYLLYESDDLSGNFEGSVSEPGVLAKQHSLNEDMVSVSQVVDDTVKMEEVTLDTLLERVAERDKPLGRLIYNGFSGIAQLMMVSIQEAQSAKEEARSAKEEVKLAKIMLEALLEEKRLKEARSEKRKNRKVRPKRDPVSEAYLDELINKKYTYEIGNFEKSRNRLCMVLLWSTGFRINETMQITLDQMKPLWRSKSPHIRVYKPKQRSYHCAFLTSRGAAVLKWVRKGLKLFDSVVKSNPKAVLWGSKRNQVGIS